MPTHSTSMRLGIALGVSSLVLLAAAAAGASSRPGDHHLDQPRALHVRVVLRGASLTHTFTPASSSTPQSEPLRDPDDITQLGRDLFVGFQNGVGPQGQPSTSDANPDSTVVELTPWGKVVRQWDVAGKVDGLTADPWLRGVIATVNEDASSALYTIQPSTGVVTAYQYSEALPHLGGTDAISIDRGRIFISASAPGTTGTPATPTPAVYDVTLNPTTAVATVSTLFNDQDSARVANIGPTLGQTVTLALTDPDSNEVVPDGARFGGDFMLTSQGDLEQVFVRHPASPQQQLRVLTLSQSVDDTAWPSDRGVLFATDSANDSVDVVSGHFDPRLPIAVATPCGANSAPGVCPAPPTYPPNFLASLNPFTGEVTAVALTGATFTPQGGLAFVADPGRRLGR